MREDISQRSNYQQEGKVAECGSPEGLSSNGGFYSRMTDIQKQSLDWAL